MSEEEQIERYIIQNLIFGDENTKLDPEISLLETGVIDSVAVMEIVLYVEECFGLSVEDNEIIPDNFGSISKLATYIRTKRSTSES